jgi:hypothetical protein
MGNAITPGFEDNGTGIKDNGTRRAGLHGSLLFVRRRLRGTLYDEGLAAVSDGWDE